MPWLSALNPSTWTHIFGNVFPWVYLADVVYEGNKHKELGFTKFFAQILIGEIDPEKKMDMGIWYIEFGIY